jgi:hypothetical protein
MRSATEIWLRWMMCWQPIEWHAKLLMSGWRVWCNKSESLAVGMVRTSVSYYSLRVTTAPGVRQGGDRERRPSFPSCCRPPPLLPAAYQFFRRFSCARGCHAQPMSQ